MLTFSIYEGTNKEAKVYDIIGLSSVDLTSVLTPLQDNQQYEINPEDLRNAVLTSLSTSGFKQTNSQYNGSYIGVDNFNLDSSNKDVKNKMYFGKRAYSPTQSYTLSDDILSSSLLNTGDDIFFFNTKKDTVSNYRTRIAILAGTTPSNFTNYSYLQSQVVATGVTAALSLDIVNQTQTGATQTTINIQSDFGTVSINDIIFPTINDSYNNSSDGKVLSWYNGSLVWDVMSFSATGYIGVTNSPLDINGSQVNLNGYSLEFTESNPCPIEIGDIKYGETFNSVSIYEMLQRMIYNYLPPLCSISILPPYSSGYVEIGSAPSVKLAYSINKRTLPTLTTSLFYMIPSSYPPITNTGHVVISGSASGVLITPVTSATTSFSISVSDGTNTNIETAFIKGIYPYFYGFSGLNSMTTTGLSSLNKLVESISDKTIQILGGGNLYFLYDDDYPILISILDDDGNEIITSFSYSTVTLSSPTGLWASKKFKSYKWTNHGLVSLPAYYRFKY